ncbi:hypothetical protein LJC69_05795, partial [Bacteroidales bacterium OttesenSCG-928-K22]|nr:hypothetical protein [Bacteroidales bacterium OttesenSCG-928-K22]
TCAFNSFEDGYEIVISVTYCGTTIFSESYDTNICPPFKVKWNCEANDNGCQYKIDVSMYNTQGVKKAGCSYSYYGCLNLITYLGNTNWGIWHSPVIID